MKMHILSGGRLRMKKQIYLPDAAREDFIDLPVSCFLLRHPQGNVLFDTGCHPGVAEDAEARWGPLARAMIPVMGKADNVVADLDRIGLVPSDIDIVVNSHLHCDHCGGNGFFTGSTVYVHADELRTARDPKMEGQGYFRSDWDHAMPIEEIEAEVDVFDDGRVVLLPSPGHSPGLTALLATLPESGTYLLASDAVPLRQNLDREIIPKNTWNADRLTHSLREIQRIEKSGARVICGHDLAQWEELKGNPIVQ